MAQQLIADFKQHEFPAAPGHCAERGAATCEKDPLSRPFPSGHTLQNDEARLRALETYSGCDEE